MSVDAAEVDRKELGQRDAFGEAPTRISILVETRRKEKPGGNPGQWSFSEKMMCGLSASARLLTSSSISASAFQLNSSARYVFYTLTGYRITVL